jgi:hypothetical protein
MSDEVYRIEMAKLALLRKTVDSVFIATKVGIGLPVLFGLVTSSFSATRSETMSVTMALFIGGLVAILWARHSFDRYFKGVEDMLARR